MQDESTLCVCGCGRTLPPDNHPNRPRQGYLKGHHFRRPTEERFWSKVAKSDGCWLWTGAIGRKGYGKFGIWGRKQGWEGAHRASWRLHYGDVPDGVFVCHRCDVPSCVRPDHLFLGTDADNVRDMHGKGRWSPNVSRAGAANNSAVLTDEDVNRVRLLFAQGMSRAGLARTFGIGWSTVDDVVQRRTWRHLP